MNYKLSKHAQEELRLRQIPHELLESVLQNPQQVVLERGGKKAYQSQLDFGGGRIFLLRAIVDDTLAPAVLVTVYRTKKIKKYWKQL
jgi:hypothetical protein